jgi:hypothetical protein
LSNIHDGSCLYGRERRELHRWDIVDVLKKEDKMREKENDKENDNDKEKEKK